MICEKKRSKKIKNVHVHKNLVRKKVNREKINTIIIKFKSGSIVVMKISLSEF